MSAADTGPRRRWLVLLPFALFLVLTAIFVSRLISGDPARLPSPLVGRPVPTFALGAVEGLMSAGRPVPGLTNKDLASGGVTLVNVFASWCAPCIEEHPF